MAEPADDGNAVLTL